MREEQLRALAEAIAEAQKRATSSRRASGPRSKLVEAIAVLLYSRPMRSSEIAEILGYNSRYIASYLSYWKTRGLFEYRDGYWMLTDEGREYAKRIIDRYMAQSDDPYALLARQIALARNDKTMYHPPGQYQQSLPFLAATTDHSSNERQKRRLCAMRVFDPLTTELEDDEREVLNIIIEHYVQWGKTYLYLDQLQRAMDADPRWLMLVLRNLQAKNILYIYHDRRMGVRIGFARQLRQKLDTCLSGTHS